MKVMLLAVTLLLSSAAQAYLAEFPEVPVDELTPGSLCNRPVEYRYPEGIAYCGRDVDRELKEEVIQEYRERGFQIPASKRSFFKIDHFIPLCAGGSNEMENLWPQHRSIYKITDELEAVGCLKLQQAKIAQDKLVELIKLAKRNLNKTSEILRQLKNL